MYTYAQSLVEQRYLLVYIPRYEHYRIYKATLGAIVRHHEATPSLKVKKRHSKQIIM